MALPSGWAGGWVVLLSGPVSNASGEGSMAAASLAKEANPIALLSGGDGMASLAGKEEVVSPAGRDEMVTSVGGVVVISLTGEVVVPVLNSALTPKGSGDGLAVGVSFDSCFLFSAID